MSLIQFLHTSYGRISKEHKPEILHKLRQAISADTNLRIKILKNFIVVIRYNVKIGLIFFKVSTGGKNTDVKILMFSVTRFEKS